MATLTDDGLTIRNQDQVFAELVQDIRADAGNDLDASAESPLGQILGTAAREIALLEELIEQVYDAKDPNKATGDALDGTLALTGTVRDGAHYTRVECECTLTSGTTLETGSHWAEVAGNPASRWTPEADYTATATGIQNVWFRAEALGPVEVAEDTITVVATALTGWTTVNNPSPEVVGKFEDTDAEARARRELDLARPGSTTLAAVISAVSDVPAVLSVSGTSNRTDHTDAAGLPAHSMHILIYDGASPSADDDAVAQAIFDESSATAGTFGTSSGTATDPDGETLPIYFSRVASVPIYIDITIKTNSDFSDATTFKAWLAEQSNATVENGSDVLWRRIDSLAFAFAGVTNVTAFDIGTSPSPSLATDIPITPSQRAYFDAANIVVTVT